MCWVPQLHGKYNISLPDNGSNEGSFILTNYISDSGGAMIDIELQFADAHIYINGTLYSAHASNCGTGKYGACALIDGSNSAYVICSENIGISATLYAYPYCNVYLHNRIVF